MHLLKENREKLEKLASRLLEREVIFSEDLEDVFGKRPWDDEEKRPGNGDVGNNETRNTNNETRSEETGDEKPVASNKEPEASDDSNNPEPGARNPEPKE